MRALTHTLIVALIIAYIGSAAVAFPIQVQHFNLSTCDTLSVPFDVDELGDPTVFPPDERIGAMPFGGGPSVCTATDDPNIPEAIVEIRNLTNRTFSELWYVADTETFISNVDGYVEDVLAPSTPPRHLAFRIDNMIYDPLGSHHPLLFESSPGGGFEPGESWEFVLQDFSNTAGLGPALFNSLQVGGASMDIAGLAPSSGSIIALPVPEPRSVAGLALLGAFFLRRGRWS